MPETPKQALDAVIGPDATFFLTHDFNARPEARGVLIAHEPAGYIPLSVAGYEAVRRTMRQFIHRDPAIPALTYRDVWLWKRANLRTPEQVIKDHWPTIAAEAAAAKIPADVLGGVLLNEMRAMMNDDLLEDLMMGRDDFPHGASWGYRLAYRMNWTDLMKSIGIAQLRPDTVLRRGLHVAIPWPAGYAGEVAQGAPAADIATPRDLTMENFQWFERRLADPVFAIKLQAAHIALISGTIGSSRWRVSASSGNFLLSGSGLIEPRTLSAAQQGVLADNLTETGWAPWIIDARRMLRGPLPKGFGKMVRTNTEALTSERSVILADEMVARKGYSLRSRDDLLALVQDGSIYLCLLGSYIDSAEEEWRDASGRARFGFKIQWGLGITESTKDIRRYITRPATPDWAGFLKNRRVHDEKGYYGPAGQMLTVDDGDLFPRRWWERTQ